jgi:hypothetical protein
MFLAHLPLLGLLMLIVVVGAVCTGASMAIFGKEGAGETAGVLIILLTYLGIFLWSLVLWVIGPAITFLHIVDGEPWASAQFRRIWETMKAGGTQYFLLFLAVFIANMIGQFGIVACYIGMFVTLPLAQAMTGAAIADYAKLVQPPSTSYPIEGGAGGMSGQPFGVKL